MNNDAGWCGSGGPWITPELSMQKIVWTETRVRRPAASSAAILPQPQAVARISTATSPCWPFPSRPATSVELWPAARRR